MKQLFGITLSGPAQKHSKRPEWFTHTNPLHIMDIGTALLPMFSRPYQPSPDAEILWSWNCFELPSRSRTSQNSKHRSQKMLLSITIHHLTLMLLGSLPLLCFSNSFHELEKLEPIVKAVNIIPFIEGILLLNQSTKRSLSADPYVLKSAEEKFKGSPSFFRPDKNKVTGACFWQKDFVRRPTTIFPSHSVLLLFAGRRGFRTSSTPPVTEVPGHSTLWKFIFSDFVFFSCGSTCSWWIWWIILSQLYPI